MARGKHIDGTVSFDDWITKMHGKGTIVKANELVSRKRNILPTVLSLDMALSGGIPDGTMCLLSGKPKAGKTSLCLQILKNAIDLGRPAFYLDIERRCKAELIKTIHGLDTEKLKMIREGDSAFSAEQWLEILERTIRDHKNAVIVVDSIAMLSTLTEQTEDIGSRKDMAGSSKLLASFFRKNQQTVDKNNVIIIFISQLMTNRDPTSRTKWVEKGGIAVQYAVSVWINITWVKPWPDNKDVGAPDGHNMVCRIVTSAMGRPRLPCELPLRYGHGMDMARDAALNAENLGLIEKAGSWYTIPSFDVKFQGIDKICTWLEENPDKLEKLTKHIKDMVLPKDES